MKGTVHDDVVLVMDARDTVGTAVADLDTDRSIDIGTDHPVSLEDPIEFGHKMALEGHEPGDEIRKYGEIIGRATEQIERGAWVHTHNLESTRGRGDLVAEEGSP